MTEIRRADVSDAPYIALLGRITFGETFKHLFRDPNDLIEYYERTFSVQKIRHSLQKPNNRFWLALDHGLPMGYAKLKLDSISQLIVHKNVCQLQKIYVLKDFLGKKVGVQLQKHLLEEARASHHEVIWLTVLDTNARAIDFYKKDEFIAVGDTKFDIGKESFGFKVMMKKL